MIFRFRGDENTILFKAKNYINAISVLENMIDLGDHYSFSHVYYNLNEYSKFSNLEYEMKKHFISENVSAIFKNKDSNVWNKLELEKIKLPKGNR